MSTARGSVLVVDDDRFNRRLLTRLLEAEGYEAKEAVDGREALAALEQAPVEVVLLDVVMPGIEGTEVLQLIKGSRGMWDVPVIMVSSVEDSDSIARCLQLGAEDYVLKPFNPVLLRARLAAALARKRFRDLEALHRRVMHEQTADLEELNRQLAQRVTELEQRERRSPPGAGDAPRRYRDAAVVCCALGAFATAASEIDATVAFEILADFASAVRDLARRYGAVAEGTFADATLVVFPDPSCAMRVSPAIEETLAPVVIQAHERHQVEINWVAGVARGDVLAGTVVVDGRERQLVVGPAVELAVAVCHEAPAGRVVFDCEAQPA